MLAPTAVTKETQCTMAALRVASSVDRGGARKRDQIRFKTVIVCSLHVQSELDIFP